MQAEDTLEPQFRLGREESPAVAIVQMGPERRAVGDFERNLRAVGISDHVVVEHDAPHPSELHAAGLDRIAARFFEPLPAVGDLPSHLFLTVVVKATLGPVPVRTQYGRIADRSSSPLGRYRLPVTKCPG